MAKNCQKVSVNDVINFFCNEIDGMGRLDGCPRNEGVPTSIGLSNDWYLCELEGDEFFRLTIPDKDKLLIREKVEKEFDPDLKRFVKEKIELLETGKDVPPLIVRTMLPSENPNSSYYIEDGAHRAISLGVFFNKNSYRPVKAYIGRR